MMIKRKPKASSYTREDREWLRALSKRLVEDMGEIIRQLEEVPEAGRAALDHQVDAALDAALEAQMVIGGIQSRIS